MPVDLAGVANRPIRGRVKLVGNAIARVTATLADQGNRQRKSVQIAAGPLNGGSGRVKKYFRNRGSLVVSSATAISDVVNAFIRISGSRQ
jgi:hypothetical protein